MAVLTPNDFGGDLQRTVNAVTDYKGANSGQNYYRFEFLVGDSINDGDTFDTGGLRITGHAWTPVNSGDFVTVRQLDGVVGSSVIEFFTSGSGHNGVLHVWAEN